MHWLTTIITTLLLSFVRVEAGGSQHIRAGGYIRRDAVTVVASPTPAPTATVIPGVVKLPKRSRPVRRMNRSCKARIGKPTLAQRRQEL